MTAARALHQHPRTARLLRPDDFSALRQSGKRIACKFFHCEYRPNQTHSARLGMAVSRRVSKLAVVRNRIRRQIRESFRLQRVNLPHYDVLIIARGVASAQDNKALRVELNLLWKKLAALTPGATNSADPHPSALNEAGSTGTMRDS